MRILLAFLLLIAFPAVAAELPVPPWQSALGRDHPLVGRIWLPAERRFAEPTELSHRLAAADFVLLGEHHDNPDHHRLQAWALAQIIAVGRRPPVAFEMVSPEQAPAMRRHLAAHPGDVDGLEAALDWSNNHWPDWAMYRPIFAEAVQAGMTLRPANLPQNVLHALARSWPLPDVTRHYYRLDQTLDASTAAALAEEIRASHCGQLPEKVVPAMVEVQRARDAAMALAMTEDAPTGAVLIAGAGHTRNDRGVPVQVAALAPGRPIFSLAFIQVADDEADPDQTLPFDAVIFTPRIDDDDPCAGLAEFLKKKREAEEQKEKEKQ